MIIHAEKTFLKDIVKINERSLLVNLQKLISNLRDVNSLSETANIKKLSGINNYYRIRLGNYRIGIYFVDNNLRLIRFLHRKDIYKYFP